jgi:adenylate kinase family enzyme
MKKVSNEKETKPVLKLMAGVGDLFTVDGVGTIEEIHQRIDSALGVEE